MNFSVDKGALFIYNIKATVARCAMRLDVSAIIYKPGGQLPFAYDLQVPADMTFDGIQAFLTPLSIRGQVFNSADVLYLQAEVETELSCTCARCGKVFQRPYAFSVEEVLAPQLEDERNTDIYPLEEGIYANVDEIVITNLVLGMETRFLCQPDCKGLCPRCGKDLNEGPCNCEKEVDPRLAALKQLLEDKE